MRGFRPDVEGLRAIAIGAVLLAHAGLPFARGGYVGVDVFFVISGFLIIGLLVRELERSGTISLASFYARRAKRLLPAAITVLVVVVVVTPLVLSSLRREVVAYDVLASALYFVNWRFISQSADYFGPTDALSPVQHHWSLAVEEQFYLVCPALLLGATWWWWRSGRKIRGPVWAVLAVVAVASFAYNVRYTAEIPSAAYFSSLTRAWEFALGGAVALLVVPRLPRSFAVIAGGAGLATIAIATFTFTDATPYPGTAALLPTLGTAAVIFAGASAPVRLLTLRPVRYVGRISYSWYLWHWPAAIFADAAWGPLGVGETTVVVAASGLPAAATYHWVEEPFRRSERLVLRPRRALALGSTCTCVGVLAAVLLLAAQPSFQTAPASGVKGARMLDEDPALQHKATAVAPNPAKAGDDNGRLHADGCLVEPLDTRSGECAYGKPPSRTSVVLFGDSHAMQYFPAIEPIAVRRGWRLVGLTKAGCPPIDATVWNPKLNREYPECDEWREHALRRIEEERPSVVLVSAAGYYSTTEGGEKVEDDVTNRQTLTSGYVEALERLRETGAQVVVIKDLPHAPHDVSDCVAGSLDDLDSCAFPIDEARGGYENRFDVAAARAVEGVKLLDVVPAICPEGVCRAVIGNAIVYRGTNHLTATFVATLAERIERQLPRLDP